MHICMYQFEDPLYLYIIYIRMLPRSVICLTYKQLKYLWIYAYICLNYKVIFLLMNMLVYAQDYLYFHC